ncbi:caspase family protein [Propionivibrio dicarboxylicus]|uniref:WD40 repeat n=1 Tax=Propionivibrio dicarboxylicus TaxID=83767 RepID=A0A1G7WTV5_9RHOO|nr:caspase family protein [Propionivibrio dicarboxylicus]SDG75371.1 WD40 repeat [Propionivibrio dicarboxylicus]
MRAKIGWGLALAVCVLVAGCMEMMAVTPQLGTRSGDRQVAVKSKVLAVASLAYSPDGRQMASAGVAPAIRVWDVASARGQSTIPLEAPYGVVGVVFSRDGKSLIATGMTGLFGDSFTAQWDVENGKKIRDIPGQFLSRLFMTPDGRYLFGAEFNMGNLFDVPYFNTKQVDLSSGTTIRTFREWQIAAMSADGRRIAVMGQARKGLALIDVQTGAQLWQVSDRHVNGVAFTPDGRYLLTSHSDYHGTLGTSMTISVTLRDAATGFPVRELLRYDEQNTFLGSDKDNAQIKFLLAAPDGSRFVSGNNKGDYRIWNLADGQLIHALKRPDEKMILDMSPAFAEFSPNGRLLAITSAASVRIYNADSGEEAAAMIAFDDGEWLVSTPSGYYNASDKGDQNLDVSVGGQPFSIAQLRESFYRPDLVKVALSGGALSEFKRVADIKPPPSVAIIETPVATDARQVSVRLRVKDQGGGIGDVRLYRNGTAVVLDRNRAVSPEAGAEGVVLPYDIPLEPGVNAIRAIAFNADNSMQSTDATISVQANIVARPPSMHAIVIGIKDFANPRLALKYTVSDATLFASTLGSKARSLFSSVNVRTLVTPADTTKTAIVEALKQAQRDVGPDDLFVFYVASHGTVDDGQYLLITSNVGSTASARLKQDALTQETLKELISNIPASKKLIVLDTCSAGQLGDALQVAMLTRGMSDDTAMKVLSRAVGSTVLSAATSVQEALEGYKGQGLFTYVIVEGLNGAADTDRDGFVKTLELADYVDNMVPELAEKVFQHKQYPIVSPTGQGFPLVRTR